MEKLLDVDKLKNDIKDMQIKNVEYSKDMPEAIQHAAAWSNRDLKQVLFLIDWYVKYVEHYSNQPNTELMRCK